MLVKLKSCADCVVVEAAKIIGTPPKKPVIMAIDANKKRVKISMDVQVGINPADNKSQRIFLTRWQVCLVRPSLLKF